MPDAIEDDWTALMRRGDFDAAWRVNDRVLQQRLSAGPRDWSVPRHQQWIWDGRELADRRVLVRCYHGLGDTLQFIRYAAPLRRLAREVIVWAQPELTELIAGVGGVDRVLPLHDGTPDVDYDVDIEIMELPHALRIKPQQLGDAPYLTVKPQRPPSEGLAVGVVAQAGGWDEDRSVPMEELQPLASVPGVRFYSLAPGAGGAMRASLGAEDISAADVTEAARRIAGLDLVISVDTMVAHLAGALGLPVWVLLKKDADWRWLAEGERTPWYPRARLFRQQQEGVWGAPISSIAAALAAETHALSVDCPT